MIDTWTHIWTDRQMQATTLLEGLIWLWENKVKVAREYPCRKSYMVRYKNKNYRYHRFYFCIFCIFAIIHNYQLYWHVYSVYAFILPLLYFTWLLYCVLMCLKYGFVLTSCMSINWLLPLIFQLCQHGPPNVPYDCLLNYLKNDLVWFHLSN